MSTLFGDGGPMFDKIVAAVRRVVQEPDTFIEVTFSVLTLRVYPARQTARLPWIPLQVEFADEQYSEKERLTRLTVFMMALSDEVSGPPTRFAFEHNEAGELSIGVLKANGEEVWMPCEITSLDRSKEGEPATARFSFLDGVGDPIVVPLRKIRL
jgi:hypothetical protein